MKKYITKYKNIKNNKNIVLYNDNTLALREGSKEISNIYDYIGNFEYNEDLKMDVALVKKNVGTTIKDTLIGYINLDGKLQSYLYSMYFDKVFCADNDSFEKLVQSIEKYLEVENKTKENKKEQGIRKVLLLAKIRNKEEHQ